MKIARLTITRRIADDGDIIDTVKAVDRDGNTLALTEALGMLRLAEDTLIREAIDEHRA